MPGPVRFTGELLPADPGAYVVVPPAAVEALRVTGRTSVRGTINSQPFANQVMPYLFEGIGRQLVIGVKQSIRADLGLAFGDPVEFVLERDNRPRSVAVEIPIELAEALAADPVAGAAFGRLAPSHRREHAEFVGSAKRTETRRRRAATTVAALREPIARAEVGPANARPKRDCGSVGRAPTARCAPTQTGARRGQALPRIGRGLQSGP